MIRALGRLLLGLLRLTLAVAVGVGIGAAWFVHSTVPRLDEDLRSFKAYRPPSTCRVYDRSGGVVDAFYVERRIWVPIDELPDVVWQAVVAAEDRRFFDHGGVDLLGIGRAALVNLAAGDIQEGGSTLTQQLVKNVIVGSERSFRRKAREALLAWRLERVVSKREVLELYLNFVYLGSGNYGVEAAAQDYFGVSARELDAGQAAMLAGLIPAPSRYSPRRSPETAAERRRIVLRSMTEEGYVSEEEAARLNDIAVDPPRRGGRGEVGNAYRTAVRREVRRLLGTRIPHREGLEVHTPYDPALQAVAEAAVEATVAAVEERQGVWGRLSRPDAAGRERFLADARGLPRDADGGVIAPAPDTCFPALLQPGRTRFAAGPFVFTLPASEWWHRVRGEDEEHPSRTFREVSVEGDVWEVCLTEGEQVRLGGEGWVDGAAVVIENRTGGVVAMTGGIDMDLEGFNRATQARRQPGSSFKPFVYAAALATGQLQIDEVLDGPLYLPGGNGRIWSPKNYGGGYYGRLPLRRALALSLNTVAVREAMRASPERIVSLASSLGVRSPLRSDLTIALGSSEVSPLDMATGYAGLARMGHATEPVFIERLVDVDQQVVGEAGGVVRIDGRAVARLPGGYGAPVVSPAVVYQIVDMMRGVVEEGTGRSAFKPGFDRAGKTGTTSGFVDAWFAGITPSHTVVVWVGSDSRASLGRSETGGRAALPAWKAIVEALNLPEGERFDVPDEVVLVPWGDRWVGLPRDAVPATILPVVLPGDEPLPVFPSHEEPQRAVGTAARPVR